ncbi:hypothetical protein JL721_2731 [Aureococcus anophagefferens]|nr:hypothetical protein JL721_2731 [Aureococcus anophagefferens]
MRARNNVMAGLVGAPVQRLRRVDQQERARGQRAAPDEAVETLHRSDAALAAARRPPAAGAPLVAGPEPAAYSPRLPSRACWRCGDGAGRRRQRDEPRLGALGQGARRPGEDGVRRGARGGDGLRGERGADARPVLRAVADPPGPAPGASAGLVAEHRGALRDAYVDGDASKTSFDLAFAATSKPADVGSLPRRSTFDVGLHLRFLDFIEGGNAPRPATRRPPHFSAWFARRSSPGDWWALLGAFADWYLLASADAQLSLKGTAGAAGGAMPSSFARSASLYAGVGRADLLADALVAELPNSRDAHVRCCSWQTYRHWSPLSPSNSSTMAEGTDNDYYALLGVPKNASTNEIRQAFRRKALEQHPDRRAPRAPGAASPSAFRAASLAASADRAFRGGDPELFQTINKAYDVLSDPERRKYYDRTGRLERTVEEDFSDGRRQAGATLQPTGQGAAPGAEQDNSTALQQRFTALQEQSHSQSFEAWMRSRNTENMVVTTETLMQDKANIAEDSYEKVRLPKVRATTIVKKTSPGPQKPGADGASVAARCTEVVFQKIPRTVDWKDSSRPTGCSGVGVVEVVGPGVRDVEDGDWVVPLRDGLGTFTSLSIWDDKDFMKVPKEIMPAGDAVVNAANGAVGQVVIQLCRLMNIRAIAITRRHDNFSDTKAWLEFLGAYKVFADDEPIVPALQREYASLPKLAFDGVGGVGTLKLIRSLAPGSTIVSYGFVGERAAAIPWQVTIKGFDLLSWIAEDRKNRKKMTSMLEQMAKLVNAGKLRVSMEEMPLDPVLDQWFDALAGTEPGMNTKVVLKMLSMEGERMREMEKQAAVEKAKRHEEEKREALRVAARELFLGPPLDVEAVATAQCYEISAKAGFRGTLIWVHGNGELPQGLMQQIEESANYVGAVVEREISLAGNASKVAIAGFSHGGVVAMYTALTKLSQPLGCCVAVGGPPVLPQLLGRKIKPHLRDTPVHCLGGAADATFPASDCKHVVDSVLSAALPAANFKEIPYGQHEVGGLEIGALADVFADNVKL